MQPQGAPGGPELVRIVVYRSRNSLFEMTDAATNGARAAND